ncbi:hypothetical protein HWV62_37033 [Athelia sp. TMB]|nr:hypothetical protein HWV62_37033 [Athelia sp. TMB]
MAAAWGMGRRNSLSTIQPTRPGDTLLPPPPYNDKPHANKLVVAETTTTTRTEVVTTTQTTTHFFSLPLWRKRPGTASSPARPSFSGSAGGGSNEGTRRASAFMLEKDLPPTPTMSQEMERATPFMIPRTASAPIGAPPSSSTLVAKASPSKPDASRKKTSRTQQPTLTLAQASLGLGLTNIVTTSSPSPSPDISTVAFISGSPVDTKPRMRRAKSSQKLGEAVPPGALVSTANDITSRTRGVSMGPSMMQPDIKGKGKVSSEALPASLSRRSSFWSRRKKDLSPSDALDTFEQSGRTNRPSLPAIPVSPLIVDIPPQSHIRQPSTPHSPGLSRSLSERHSTHSSTSPRIESSSRSRPRATKHRPSTADPSTLPHTPHSRPTTDPSSRDPEHFMTDSANRRAWISPVKASHTLPPEMAYPVQPRPRSQTNPPLLHRLSMNLFTSAASTKSNSTSGSGMFASPTATANNSPRPSTSKRPVEAPKPQINDESPDAYADRLLQVVNKAEIAGVLASSGDPFYVSALRSYMARFDFKSDPLDVALRKLLMEVGLPRETQQIDRVVESFAGQYVESNPGLFTSEDAFNKSNKRKMTKADYIKNTRLPGVPPEVLDCYFDNITFAPFIFIEDPLDVNGQRTITASAVSAQSMSRSTTQTNGSSSTLLGKGSKIDPYFLITHNLLDPLRVSVEDVIPLESPYSYTGTKPLWDEEELHQAFARATIIEIGASDVQRGHSHLFGGMAVMPNPPMGVNALPEYYPATGEVLTLKITKFGLLNRKDDVLEGGRRANNRKWKPWSVILTGSQLLLFRDPAWATTLLVKPETPDGQLLFPQTSLFKPDELLSVKDSIAVYDKSYAKYPNTLRFVSSDGRQFLLRTSDETELNEWVSRINYASAFKSAGVRMRALGMSGKDVELTGVAAATSHLRDMQIHAHTNHKAHSWDGDAALDLMGMLSGPPPSPKPPAARKVTILSGRNDMDLDAPTAPELDGAYQFKLTFDQVKAELAAGNWESDESSDADHALKKHDIHPAVAVAQDSPLPTRSQIIQSKIRDLDSKIASAQSSLETDMRFVRNVAILTPFQKATRDRLLLAVQTVSGKVTKMRIELAKLTCHRDVLSGDLVAEQRDLHNAKDIAFRAAAQTLQSRRATTVPQMTLTFHDDSSPSSPRPFDASSIKPPSSIAESFHSALDFGPDWSSENLSAATMLDTSRIFDSPSLSTPITPGGTHGSSGSFPFPNSRSNSAHDIDTSPGISPVESLGISHERFYTAAESTAAEECEEWNKTRAAKRVSLPWGLLRVSPAHPAPMDSSIKKTPSRKRLSLILKSNNENVSSTIGTEKITPQASASTSNASPITFNASPSTKSHRRRASLLFSTSLSSIMQSPMPEEELATIPTSSQGSLARKARGLSDAFLRQLAVSEVKAVGEEGLQTFPSDGEFGLASPGGSSYSSSQSLPSQKRLRRSSSARTIQRVKSFIMPHPSLPEMKVYKAKAPRYETISATSLVPAPASTTPSIAEDVFAEMSPPSGISLVPSPPANTGFLEAPSSITLNSPKRSIEEYPVFQDASRVSPGRRSLEKRRRRMSFDFSSLRHQPPAILPNPRGGLARSKTMTTPRARVQEEHEEVLDQTQKAMNVRRARKMLTLFGSEPPFALYHHGSSSEKTEADMLMPPSVNTARQRDSLTTIVSLASLASAHRRSSSASTTADSPTKARGPRSPTPPPFISTTRPIPDIPSTSTPPTTPITLTTFTARRRRAAKLARFFGVGYHDVPTATSPAAKTSAISDGTRTPPVAPGVNVQVSSPGWFWGRRHTSQDVDIDDVIGKLRNMKAAR